MPDFAARARDSRDSKSDHSLDSLKKVHIIGVCGTLMGAFAAYLKRRGIEVTGSDQNVYPPMSDVLTAAGVELFSGYRAENLTAMAKKPDLVVIGNVIPASNLEARAAIDGGYDYSSLPEAMERYMLPRTRNLVVAGTHGKTTTSSLLAHALTSCGKNPSYFIGGVSHDLPFSFNVTSVEPGKLFVLEGDEYDTAFWDKVPKFNHYLPDDVILTSIEYDHADIYPDFAAVQRAFDGLIDRIRPGGRLIACHDFAAVRELVAARAKDLEARGIRVISYGAAAPVVPEGVTEGETPSHPAPRFTPARIRVDGEITRFEVLDNGKPMDEVTLRLPGLHNVVNALAVWIESRELGIENQHLRRAIASFRGVKRRQEVRGEPRGVTVIDDFAHHPTAVRETLRALRLKYPKRRLVAVFEPRSATSRRKVFQRDYHEAFLEGDSVFIAVPYDQSKIAADDQFSSDQLVADLVRAQRAAQLMDSIEGGVTQVADYVQPGDVVAVLSNGGFGGFIPKLLAAIEAAAAAPLARSATA